MPKTAKPQWKVWVTSPGAWGGLAYRGLLNAKDEKEAIRIAKRKGWHAPAVALRSDLEATTNCDQRHLRFSPPPEPV